MLPCVDLLVKMCAQKLQKIEDGNLLSKISLTFPMHLPKLASPFFVAPTLDGGQSLLLRAIAANFGSNWRCILNSTLHNAQFVQ